MGTQDAPPPETRRAVLGLAGGLAVWVAADAETPPPAFDEDLAAELVVHQGWVLRPDDLT